MTRFIGVLGKGGVGKTTVSINLAMALRRLGKDVILIDLNQINPKIASYLGIDNLPITLSNVFKENKSIFDSLYLHPSGIKIAPSNGLDVLRKDKLNNIFSSLEGTAEVVLVDTGNFSRKYLDFIDEALIITDSDKMSVKTAEKMKRLAEEKGITVLGVILNKFDNEGISAAEIEKATEGPLLYVFDSNDLKSKKFDFLADKIAGLNIKKTGLF